MSSVLLVILLSLLFVRAEPAFPSFTDCFDDDADASLKFDITSVYAQVLDNAQHSRALNLTVLGRSSQNITGRADNSPNLATLFTSTSVLTLSAWSNTTYLCDGLRPPSPLPTANETISDYCPITPGPFAFSTLIPWGEDRALTTLTTRLRAVDPFSKELFCIEVETTPLEPSSTSPYGIAEVIFWASVALAILYWVFVGVARITSAWNRGNTRPSGGVWTRAQSAGYILASAISGERFRNSPALMRFCTPSLRDIIFHTQWCAALCMVAVQWPTFIYPILTRTAWATLTYNVTLSTTPNIVWDPLSVPTFEPPSEFAEQFADSSSPIYIDRSAPNTLFMLPEGATQGMASFAYTIGVRPEDLFKICMTLFLGIMAATVAISFVVWAIDGIACAIAGLVPSQGPGPNVARLGAKSPAFSNHDILDNPAAMGDDPKSPKGRDAPGNITRPPSRFALAGPTSAGLAPRKWFRFRGHSSFHGAVLQGNLVRVLVLFHLPVTIFSVYQMTLPKSRVSLSSIVLATFSFVVFSIIIPAVLVLRVRLTTTSKLFDETRTLLALGPLYNQFRHGSQIFASMLFVTNIVMGVTIGGGQQSGTAQAIVILVVEVVSALVTSVWLPWGPGASMGLISFLFCVARIVIAVLLVILCPAINIGAGPGGWVAYGILIILALVYLALVLMLLVKLIEALVRIVGGVGFETSRHSVDSGLLGAMGLAGCCGRRRRRRPADRKNGKHAQHKSKNSDHSSFAPPTALGTMNGNSSFKGSMHSGPPPSVLKPEHAFRPYREESDDENGFIMGAWQPFANNKSSSGYIPVNNDRGNRSPQAPAAKPSGFSRVGGGKAHIDSPYSAISTTPQTSTQHFPSLGHEQAVSQSTGSTLNDPPLSLSSNTAVRQQQMASPDGDLPQGAMSVFHARTKSQTAIVENGGAGFTRPGSRAKVLDTSAPPPSSYFNPGPSRANDTDDEGSESDTGPTKKKWFTLGRKRPRSSDGSATNPPPEPPTLPFDEESGGLSLSSGQQPGSTSGRSFVVVRKGQQSPARPQPSAEASGSQV